MAGKLPGTPDGGPTRYLGDVSRLGELTSHELLGRRVVVLVPIGSCEQHGPHLPLDTDSRIADAVAMGAAARRVDVVVAPTMTASASDEHAGFPGLISVGNHATALALAGIVRSASQWARHVVLVNGHGGNASALRQVGGVHWFPLVAGGDAHAGRTETSLMLAIAPQLVRLDKAQRGNVAPLWSLMPSMQLGGVRSVSSSGVLGDPMGASAGEGRMLLTSLVGSLIAVIDALPD